MSTLIETYPFDPTGSLVSNQITNEQQVVNAVNYRDYHTVIPRWAPFFAETVVATIKLADGTVKPLVRGIDWQACFQFISASRACSKPIWGGMQLMDKTLSGVISLTYQTLGGTWTLDEAQVSELLAYALHDPRVTAWEEVIELPIAFPVIDHEWDLADLVGASEVVAGLNAIEEAIRSAGGGDITAHINNFSNPHQVNKTQVLLGNVQNFPIATPDDVNTGTSNTAYMTPAMTYLMLNAAGGVGTGLLDHKNDHNNPHAVTADQVGAYTKAEVTNLLTGKLSTTGSAADSLKFNGRDDTTYRDWAMSTGTASNALKLDGLTQAQLAAQILAGQAADSAKFAGQTPAQFMSDVLAGKVADSFKFDGKDAATFAQWVLDNGTAANTTNVNGMSPSQYATWVLTQNGPAANATLFDGKTYDQVLAAAAGGGQNLAFAPQVVISRGGVTEAAGTYYTEIAQFSVPNDSDTARLSFQDVRLLVSGGDVDGAAQSAAYLVQINRRGASPNKISTDIINLTRVGSPVEFGISTTTTSDVNGTYITGHLWAKTGPNINAMSVTSVGDNAVTLIKNNRVNAAPAGYTAQLADVYARESDVANVLTSLKTAFDTLAAGVTA